jgi:hypothetical protein
MKRGSGWRSSPVLAKTTMGGGEGAAATRWVHDNPSEVRRAFARRQLMFASSLPLRGGFYSKRGAEKAREKLSVWDQLPETPQKLNQTGAICGATISETVIVPGFLFSRYSYLLSLFHPGGQIHLYTRRKRRCCPPAAHPPPSAHPCDRRARRR